MLPELKKLYAITIRPISHIEIRTEETRGGKPPIIFSNWKKNCTVLSITLVRTASGVVASDKQ